MVGAPVKADNIQVIHISISCQVAAGVAIGVHVPRGVHVPEGREVVASLTIL